MPDRPGSRWDELVARRARGGTYHRPHGGEFTRIARAWLYWHLKDVKPISRMFLGEDSELRRDPQWTIAVKNFPAPCIRVRKTRRGRRPAVAHPSGRCP